EPAETLEFCSSGRLLMVGSQRKTSKDHVPVSVAVAGEPTVFDGLGETLLTVDKLARRFPPGFPARKQRCGTLSVSTVANTALIQPERESVLGGQVCFCRFAYDRWRI